MPRKKHILKGDESTMEVMDKYNVSRKTALAGKARGYIYGNNRGETASDTAQQAFLDLMGLPGIIIRGVKSLGYQKIYNVQHGRSTITKEEAVAIAKEFNTLATKLHNAKAPWNILGKDDRIRRDLVASEKTAAQDAKRFAEIIETLCADIVI